VTELGVLVDNAFVLSKEAEALALKNEAESTQSGASTLVSEAESIAAEVSGHFTAS